MSQRKQVFSALQAGTATTRAIAAATGIRTKIVSKYLCHMRDDGLVEVAAARSVPSRRGPQGHTWRIAALAFVGAR